MLQRPTFRSTWLPIGLGVLALLVLNVGLYTRLAAQPELPSLTLPYHEDFSTISEVPYEQFGGDWEIRDETLVQLSTSGYDLMSFVPLDIPVEQTYAFEATLRYLGGTMGGGLVFNAQQTTSRQQSHMVRFNVDADQLWLIYGYFADDSDFIGQGSAQIPIAPADVNTHKLRVQTNGETYTIFFDEFQVGSDIPLAYYGGAVGFISATSQVAFDDVAVDAVIESLSEAERPATLPSENTTANDASIEATLLPASGTIIFADSFDTEGGASLWQPISGNWAFADGAYVQSQTEGFDLGTIYQQPITYPITLSAAFVHRQGAGGGLLFNLPASDSKNGGHMVRYVEDGSVIAWGYFDENGVFNGQGSAGVAIPGQETHTLSVSINDQSYTVYLDDTQLVADVPTVNTQSPSYIGLTASQSIVAFSDITVTSSDNQNFDAETTDLPPSTTADINAESATGTWAVDGGIITQTDTENTDYIAGTGLAGEQFTISTDITLPPDNLETGAGIVFHMEGRDDRRMGHMMRFGSGGKELFWGRYDTEGTFIGEGGIPLDLPAGEPIKLVLIVSSESFDIQVNGEVVVEDIPVQSDGGWIGLVSFGGPVTFSNVNLQLGQ